ncbi:helix-turn-helix transcriptional regulator [Paenibacillus rhizovicinus]|uniref:Helix-turn-helix transcriptional regulator n=1 Tax=Paenibacillus rhizovicinus TaxID=2704463 RepID=A0A6C0P5W7_9BACL|nr:AraC family transcriptional regulator [Paenibacillus rhizovicinus]QHW33706.1 helix-turn-helix transcriptional regulator [Paenibacillus rhizovicinus]
MSTEYAYRTELEALCGFILRSVFHRIPHQPDAGAPELKHGDAPAADALDFIYRYLASALHQAMPLSDEAYRSGMDRNERKVEEALSYIEAHYENDFGLDQLTETMRCSSTYLNRLLKQYTGNTFYNLLTRKRIERSKQLLSQDRLTVGEISAAVGYTNVHSFIRAFKRSEGITPGQYRESCMSA